MSMGQHPISRAVRWRALAVAAGALALGLLLPGCLTDGSIPVGGGTGGAALRGVVVYAEQPGVPVAGGRVTVLARNGLVIALETDERGRWELSNVPQGLAEITFEGPPAESLLPIKINARAEYDSFTAITVALEPSHMAAADPDAVILDPETASLRVGERLRFHAQILGGNPNRQVPTWVVEGGVGTISPEGDFLALRAGTGLVRAIAGSREDTAAVTVTAGE